MTKTEAIKAFNESLNTKWRGALVKVEAYGKEIKTVRVWGHTDEAFYVYNEENYRLRAADKTCPDPVGFHHCYVIGEPWFPESEAPDA